MKIIINNKKNNRKAYQMLAASMVAAVAINMIPDASHADVSDVFSNTLCGVVSWFTGRTGKAVATMAVIFLGIAAFFGKVTWGLALMFAVGIFAIFGAASIVNAVSSGEADSSGTSCIKKES